MQQDNQGIARAWRRQGALEILTRDDMQCSNMTVLLRCSVHAPGGALKHMPVHIHSRFYK
eukprot:1161741-Pelagomonas_calceolata.AAC.16